MSVITNTEKLYNTDVEKYAISAILQHSTLFDEIDNFVSSKDYYHDVNGRIHDVIKSFYLQNKKPDIVLVASRIEELRIVLPNKVKALDYLRSLSMISIKKESGKEYFQQLRTFSIKRDFLKSLRDSAEYIKTTTDGIDKITSKLDSLSSQRANIYNEEDQPKSLFSSAREIINERMKNPGQARGFWTGFKEFDEIYGGVRPKNLYVIGSRAGSGKTTFLSYLAHNIANIFNSDKKIKVLYLDTEMEFEDSVLRTIAAITGIAFNDLDDGSIAKSKSARDKVDKVLEEAEKKNFSFDFLKVGNKNTDQIMSICRRWYNSQVGRGNNAIIVYDYLKLTGESISEAFKEYMVMGDKVDRFKKLAEELNVVVLSAVQLNRGGENQGKKFGSYADSSAEISITDRLSWFASFVALFKVKTLDQVRIDGPENGTHQLVVTKARFQGKKAPGHFDMIERIIDGKKQYVRNYISFDVKNFNVTEVGSLMTILKRGKNKINVQTDNDSQKEEDVNL